MVVLYFGVSVFVDSTKVYGIYFLLKVGNPLCVGVFTETDKFRVDI